MRPLSGIQHEMRLGDQRVVITAVGAGLRAYTVGPRPIVGAYADTEMCTNHGAIPRSNQQSIPAHHHD